MGGGKGKGGKGGEKGKAGKDGKDGKGSGKGKKGAEEEEDESLAAALGVDQFEEADEKCPWCQGDYSEDSNFCGSCGRPRKALTCYNCESHYLKGSKFCRSCGLPRPAMAPTALNASPDASPSNGPSGPSAWDASGAVGLPGSGPGNATAAHEPHDWIYEDGLVKEMAAPDINDLILNGDDAWPMRDMCRTVENALDVPYYPMMQDLNVKLNQMRGRVDFASAEKQRWRGERRELREKCLDLQTQVEEEKDKALQRATRVANHSLAVTLSGGGPRPGRATMRMAQAGGLELMDANEQDAGPIDTAANMILKSRVGGFMMSFARSIIPLQSDVQNISSQFGSSCGTFFKFYSYLLLLALFAAAAFSPLILSQSEKWQSYNARICGYLPCALFLGSFYQSTSDPEEQWLTALDLRVHSNGSLVAQTDIGQSAFDSQFATCPMVRFVRDCRVFAVFAGFIDNTSGSSAYEIFTSSWKDISGTQNEDWVIYSRFADLVQAEEPWPSCSTSSGQGFPGNCLPKNVQLSGRWFGLGSFNGSMPSFGFQLELFNASRCFASSRSDIRNMAGGIPVTFDQSSKDLNVAFWYVFGNVVSIVFAVFFVLVWWQISEANYNFEQFSEKLEPMRWSCLVIGLWNFRLNSESDRELWRQSVANQLRMIYAEEKDQEHVKSRTSTDENVLFLKRFTGFLVNTGIIVGLWNLIWICARDRQLLVESLGSSLESCCGARGVGEWLGFTLAPLVVTGAGLVLPPTVELLTRLEAWPRAWRALLNIYRFFLGQILTAMLYMAISLELLYDLPLWSGRDLLLQPLVEPCGTYPCKADHAGSEVIALVVTEFVMMMIKPFLKLGMAYLRHRVKHLLGVKGDFLWPEFQIQDDAVNVVYFSALVWMSLSTVPYMALIGPLLMYIHFKWLKLSLKYLTRRPFVTETTSLLVTLQRISCFNFVVLGFLVMAQIILIVPYEPLLGP
eukprot:s1201_g16.t1